MVRFKNRITYYRWKHSLTRFDFLGFQFESKGLSVGEEIIEQFVARAVRIYKKEVWEGYRLPQAWIVCEALTDWGYGGLSQGYNSRKILMTFSTASFSESISIKLSDALTIFLRYYYPSKVAYLVTVNELCRKKN